MAVSRLRPNTDMSDIFLSYASADRERALPLANVLESQGLDVWWDRGSVQ